jgi:mannose/fructose-specific phosphotransferase system component IIA
MTSNAVRGLVVTHGGLAQGLVDAVRRITGCEETALVSLSNEGLGPEGLEAAVRETAAGGPTILFTDLPSGSCSFAARKVAVGEDEVAAICGVNLPLLVDFVFHREMELGDLVTRLVEKGRRGIDAFGLEALEHADRSL